MPGLILEKGAGLQRVPHPGPQGQRCQPVIARVPEPPWMGACFPHQRRSSESAVDATGDAGRGWGPRKATLRLCCRVLRMEGSRECPREGKLTELELGVGAESLEQPRPPATQGLQRLAQLSCHSVWL